VSNISVNTITDASGGSTASINGLTPQASNMQPFNRIINGAMTIDQRNAGASVTVSDQYTLDRWSAYENNDGAFTVQRSTTAPTGFSNSLLATVTTADSSLTTNQQTIVCRQWIEAANMVGLAWGTASAKTVTLSFWVRGSVTGTYGITISNSANDVVYAATYTISVANTFEYKTITIPGSTSGTWPTDNGRGMIVTWSLGAGPSVTVSSNNSWISSPGSAALYAAVGQTNVMATLNATWYITGVQLEAGSSASSFAHENYGDTLQKCQRYYQRQFPVRGVGTTDGGTVGRVKAPLIVTMRASPTATLVNTLSLYDGAVTRQCSALSQVWATPDLLEFDGNLNSSSFTVGRCIVVYNDTSSGAGSLPTAGITLSSEL
jgi:hypothetical protein